MKPQLLLLTALIVALAACGTLSTPEPTPTPTATPDLMSGIREQATMNAALNTASAIQMNATNTAYAPTQHAAETATERAWAVAGWTATAAIEQTAVSLNNTATAAAWTPTPNYTATVAVAQAAAKATALHGEAVSVELAVERERMMNTVQAVAPWLGLGAVLVAGLVLAFRWSRVRPIQRDPRGDAPLMVIDGKVYDADRNPLPVADFSGKKAQIPNLTPPELQAPTTARDQMIDLATRGNQNQPQRRAIAQKMAAPNNLPQAAPVRVLPPEQARPLLGDVIPGIVQDAIETDLNSEG